MPKEDLLLEDSILELILSMLLQEEFLALIFGKMVRKKLNTMPMLISHITSQFQSKSKCKSKTKQTKSFYKVTK